MRNVFRWLMEPALPDYDPIEWSKLPFSERGRLVCQSWALQGYGTPLAPYLFYAVKALAYVGAWLFFCSLSPSLGDIENVSAWWLSPLAFQKAIIWSLLFEVLGLGCGSGPLTGHYMPPIGGALYWLRPGTTKLALFPHLPLFGGRTRSMLDVGLYALLLVSCLVALIAPALTQMHFLLIVITLATLGICDRTIFLAARSEHYWVTLLLFAFVESWIASAQAIQLALWFFAGFSKLNHHFPTVVCVMNSNGPFTRFAWWRKRMYKRFPEDLRPSKLATLLAHMGTALELAVPIAFVFTPTGTTPLLALGLMVLLHVYILSTVPLGVPIEWNLMVLFGGFALFYGHPEIAVLDLPLSPMTLVLLCCVVGLPLIGNLFPRKVSFLLAMRYYAGNWPSSVYLFRGDAHRKLESLTKSSPWIYDQLDGFYDRSTSEALVGKVLGFRLMHLHGRALPTLVPKAVDKLTDYQLLDGELIAGLVLGWNFGDGHLHQESLLANLQEQLAFEPGELRCIFLSSQPMFCDTQDYRIYDAATGLLDEGKVSVSEMRTRQPWES